VMDLLLVEFYYTLLSEMMLRIQINLLVIQFTDTHLTNARV
jgi:hypothetical protein